MKNLEHYQNCVAFKYGTVDYPSTQIGRLLRKTAIETARLRVAVGIDRDEDHMVINPNIAEPSSILWVTWYFQNIAGIENVRIYPIPDLIHIKDEDG